MMTMTPPPGGTLMPAASVHRAVERHAGVRLVDMLDQLRGDDHWSDQAACKGTPIWWWYAPEGGSDDEVVPEAIALCDRCPVRSRCLEHAIANENNGTWGGNTPTDFARRRKVAGIKRNRFAEPPTVVGVPEAPPPTAFPDPREGSTNDERWIARASRRNATNTGSPPNLGGDR